MNSVKIKEIFESIQGEGPYIGYKQLFIRFCNCNLKCNYCDTDFLSNSDYIEYNAFDLANKVNKYNDIHSVSLTGGEPLLSVEFLKEFLPLTSKKIYLETNATLAEKLLEVKKYIDIVAADIKLESASGIKNTLKYHDKFFEACKGIETFAKIVFNKNITDFEIDASCKMAKKYYLPIVLQPEMGNDTLYVDSEFCENTLNKFLKYYSNVRLIPQVHKFMNIR